MLIKSALLTQASGSTGGMTASHNRGGMYLRSRAIPTNPNTGRQVVVRGILSALVVAWNNTLTPTQRENWNTYATNTPVVNVLGDSKNLSGINMYCRCNVPRIQAGLARIDNAPTTFNLGAMTNPTLVSATAGTGIVVVSFTNTDAWATATGGALLIYLSRPQNAGVNFFRGPYAYAGRVNGLVVPPTSPANITAPFPFTAGSRVFARIRASLADGRLTADWFGGVVAV